jgi:hypothetical protein
MAFGATHLGEFNQCGDDTFGRCGSRNKMLRKDLGGLRPINRHCEHLRAANIDAHQSFTHT